MYPDDVYNIPSSERFPSVYTIAIFNSWAYALFFKSVYYGKLYRKDPWYNTAGYVQLSFTY